MTTWHRHHTSSRVPIPQQTRSGPFDLSSLCCSVLDNDHQPYFSYQPLADLAASWCQLEGKDLNQLSTSLIAPSLTPSYSTFRHDNCTLSQHSLNVAYTPPILTPDCELNLQPDKIAGHACCHSFNGVQQDSLVNGAQPGWHSEEAPNIQSQFEHTGYTPCTALDYDPNSGISLPLEPAIVISPSTAAPPLAIINDEYSQPCLPVTGILSLCQFNPSSPNSLANCHESPLFEYRGHDLSSVPVFPTCIDSEIGLQQCPTPVIDDNRLQGTQDTVSYRNDVQSVGPLRPSDMMRYRNPIRRKPTLESKSSTGCRSSTEDLTFPFFSFHDPSLPCYDTSSLLHSTSSPLQSSTSSLYPLTSPLDPLIPSLERAIDTRVLVKKYANFS
jgi:hypothetical protein